MPKKNNDYAFILNRQAALAEEAALRLERFSAGCDVFALPQAMAEIDALAAQSRALRRRLCKALLGEFLPPMERGDLLAVSAALEALVFFRSDAGVGTHERRQMELLKEAVALLPRLKKEGESLLQLAWQAEDLTAGQGSAPYGAAVNRLVSALEHAVLENL
jgi:hypothetical protein